MDIHSESTKEKIHSPAVIDTDAKVVAAEIIKQKPEDFNQGCEKFSTFKRFEFGLKSVLTAIIGIIISVFSFLFFGFVILFIFAVPILAFVAIRLFNRKGK